MAAASMTMTSRKAGRADLPPDAAVPEGAVKPKGKRKLLVVVGLVAVLGVAAVAYPKLTHKKPASGFKSAALAVPNGPIESLDPVTVNLSDGHLLQVGVAVQLTQTADAKKVTAMDPRILDAVISTFSALTYPSLLGSAGHEQARRQLEVRLQTLFPPVAGAPQVAGVYFTSFVMQ
jgi:flagellar protein FliL